MDQEILREQIDYYRARAQEYDETTWGIIDPQDAFARAGDLLRQLGPFEQVLELASGTGIWTQFLLDITKDITALDASQEMQVIAKQKLGTAPVHYQQADLFQWEPEREYQLVFFANWLSHVPPQELPAFLARVARAVRPGGYIAIVDQHTPTPEDQQIRKAGEGGEIYAQRLLRDGKTFTIIKVFYDEIALQQAFADLGFEVIIHRLSDIFFFLEARRRE